MMKRFPLGKFDSAAQYGAAYLNEMQRAAASIDVEKLNDAARLLGECINTSGTIFVCGNGGSAAISDHFCCDTLRTARNDTTLRPRVMSLASTTPVVTAIGNDIGFEEIFSNQLDSMVRKGDLLFTVSSSGNSENIVRAIAVAKAAGVPVISMTGFDGGRSRNEADVSLHVDCHNYGIVEDLHQSFMHILMQYVRQDNMPADLVEKRVF